MRDCYSFTTEYGAADELFKAILSLDKKRVSALRAADVALSEAVKRVLVNGGGSIDSDKPETRLWYFYLIDIKGIDAADFVYISREFYRETGAALYYSETIHNSMWGNFYNAKVFGCFLDCYNQTKMNKTRLMKGAIDANSVECLAICAEHGWLKMPRKRDEMIEYATKENKTECTAFLLEFKNKNFNLAEERVKAEKKAERELNADPFSVTELKKLWKYEKQTDGTIMITGYKGNALEIAVPARIGKAPVTAVGERAFSPNAMRITEEQALVRCRITKITVPEGVRTIGEGAFGGAGACRAVKGFFNAFSDLREVVLPRSLEAFSSREAAENAPRIFVNCRLLKVKVPHAPYAEVFCRSQNVDFEFFNV